MPLLASGDGRASAVDDESKGENIGMMGVLVLLMVISPVGSW